jgi:hypothetical protein
LEEREREREKERERELTRTNHIVKLGAMRVAAVVLVACTLTARPSLSLATQLADSAAAIDGELQERGAVGANLAAFWRFQTTATTTTTAHRSAATVYVDDVHG